MNTTKKLLEIYSSLHGFSDAQLADLMSFVEQLKIKNGKKTMKFGQLAGLCEVEIPDNLESELRLARQEIASSILAKKI